MHFGSHVLGQPLAGTWRITRSDRCYCGTQSHSWHGLLWSEQGSHSSFDCQCCVRRRLETASSIRTTLQVIVSYRTELPKDASVLGVLPMTIDTPMNRKFMASADFSSWTKVWRCGSFVPYIDYMTVSSHVHYKLNQTEDIAQKILEWSSASYAARPPSGHLITATTENNTTSWKDAGNPFQ